MNEKIAQQNAIMSVESAKAPFRTIAWHQASAEKGKLKATNNPTAKAIKSFLAAPSDWGTNPGRAIFLSKQKADELNAAAKPASEETKASAEAALLTASEAESIAATYGYKDEALNKTAMEKIQTWLKASSKASKAKAKASIAPYNKLPTLIGLMIILALFFSIGLAVMGKSATAYYKGFAFVFVIAVLSYIMEKQATMKLYGFGFPLWAIVFGMLISNTIGTPKWVVPAVQTEYYIKTGLVLLGGEVLFTKILAIGIPGIFVAWIVTPIVLVCTYIFGQAVLKIPSKTLNITISSDMSVCGVSAAIATAAACRAKKEELTLAIGLSMVFTAIMMVAMPAFIKAVGMPQILGGAWMGGTIDATGAVAAAGAFLGDKALYVAATVKMIQNVMIGVIAFFVALYWSVKVDRQAGQEVRVSEIWHRFPKFVLGFIGCSILFSLMDASLGKDVSSVMLDNGVIKGFSKLLREWFFALAFASIGLATNFRELRQYFKGGKPLILYVCGQSFNLALTLGMAYIMFYLVFPEITAQI
jgi:uncharacterized membrane protein YadS